MVTPSGIVLIEKGKSRLFKPLYSFMTLYDCLNVAVHFYVTNGNRKFKLGDYGIAQCEQFPLQIKHLTGGLVEAALRGKPLWLFPIEVEAHTGPAAGHTTSAFQDLVTNIISPLFTDYYENHLQWLEPDKGRDGSQWPAVLDFARVIRNSASHGGKLTFKGPNSRTVQWHHLKYGPPDNGKQVLGKELVLGDILLLMLEMAKEYDRLDYPTPA